MIKTNIVLAFIYLLYPLNVYCQYKYALPLKLDSISIHQTKFDFWPYGKKVSISDKINYLDRAILANDTNYVFQLLGFQTYRDFKVNQHDYGKYPWVNRHIDIDRYLSVLDLNGDSSLDVLFDDLNPWMEFQRIHIAINKGNGWKNLDVKGFIITNANITSGILSDFDTYEWACCDYPYCIYRRYVSSSDTFKLKETIGIPTSIDQKLITSNSKLFDVGQDSVVVYTDYQYQSGFVHVIKLANCKVREHDRVNYNGQDYILIEFPNKFKAGLTSFDKFFGWIKTLEK